MCNFPCGNGITDSGLREEMFRKILIYLILLCKENYIFGNNQ